MTDDDAVEAQHLEEALEWALDTLMPEVVKFRADHSDAETVLGIKRDFVNMAYLRMAYGGTSILGDYVGYGLALLRLLDARERIAELEEAVAFRDDCLKNLGAWEDL